MGQSLDPRVRGDERVEKLVLHPFFSHVRSREAVRKRSPGQGLAYFTLKTSTPGNGLPSSHSRKAPPAADT